MKNMKTCWFCAALAAVLALSACKEKSPSEKAADAMKDGAEAVKDGAKKTGEKVSEGAEKAADKVKDATK
jgi:outer membrane lipoprotein-sorting protein